MHGVVNIPITFVVAFILSYYTIGLYSTLTAFGTVLLFIPIQFYIGKGVQACRLGFLTLAFSSPFTHKLRKNSTKLDNLKLSLRYTHPKGEKQCHTPISG